MKTLYLLAIATAVLISCSKKGDDSPPPETDVQKAAKICWMGYSQMTVSKNSQGRVYISIPIDVADTARLKKINMYIKGSQLLWSKDNPKKGNIATYDDLTNWAVTKTQTYNFEFVLSDGTKLRLEDFTATP